jgi:hypothetical protein
MAWRWPIARRPGRARRRLVISRRHRQPDRGGGRSLRAGLKPGAFFLDFNSASPGAKIRAAGIVNAAGGRYVEGAVMTSVPPYRIKVPLLLGGPDAAALAPLLATPGLRRQGASERLGVASATKMCRSVMIKGLEAMVIESFTTARHYGVEDAVIASLHETFPGIDWEKQARLLLPARHRTRPPPQRRSARGGRDRARGRPHALVASGTAERQAWVADLADAGLFGTKGTPGLCPQRRLAHRSRPHPRAQARQGLR